MADPPEDRGRALAALFAEALRTLETLPQGDPYAPGILQMVLTTEETSDDFIMTMMIVEESGPTAEITSITSKDDIGYNQEEGSRMLEESAGSGSYVVSRSHSGSAIHSMSASYGVSRSRSDSVSLSSSKSSDVMQELAAVKKVLVEQMNLIQGLCKKMSLLEQRVDVLRVQTGDKMIEMEQVSGEIDYLKEEQVQMQVYLTESEELPNGTGDDETMERVMKLLVDQNRVINNLNQQKADIKQQIDQLNQELDQKSAELDEVRNELQDLLKEHEIYCKQLPIDDLTTGKEAQPFGSEMDVQRLATLLSQMQKKSIVLRMSNQKQDTETNADQYFDAADTAVSDKEEEGEDAPEEEVYVDAEEGKDVAKDNAKCCCSNEFCSTAECVCQEEEPTTDEDSFTTATEVPVSVDVMDHPPSSPKERPLPPDNLRVIAKIGKDSLLVGWDASGDQNVIGYEVHVDGELNNRIRSASRDRAMLWPLNLRNPLQISMFSYNEHGLTSSSLELTVNPSSD